MTDQQARSLLARRLQTLLRFSKAARREAEREGVRHLQPPPAAREEGVQARHTAERNQRVEEAGRISPPTGRIVWQEFPVENRAHPGKAAPALRSTIEWKGQIQGALPDPETLIGVEDAFEHTPLLPGERVAFCVRDQVAYHLETWNFLRTQNRGRCCVCGQAHTIRLITLPGSLPAPSPAPSYPTRTEPGLPGEKIISLQEVYDHLNLAVTVQEVVHEVYQTKSTGTYFVRFEPRAWNEPPFSGFKVVIFNNYLSRWAAAGLSVDDYAGRCIRVRGLVQQHPRYGIEIVVTSPGMIEILPA